MVSASRYVSVVYRSIPFWVIFPPGGFCLPVAILTAEILSAGTTYKIPGILKAATVNMQIPLAVDALGCCTESSCQYAGGS